MKRKPPGEQPLSPHRAFVVQLREETDIKAGRLIGRVEHVVSGEAARFRSVHELLAFLARMLARSAGGPPHDTRSDEGED